MSIHAPDKPKVSLPRLAEMRANGERITMLSCADASFASMLDSAGVDILLVGDSLGMTIQGHGSTLPVTVEHMVYHTTCVARGAKRALVLGDLPYASYHESSAQAFHNAAQLMAAGAGMVKLEGGAIMADTVRFMVERGIPVCGHVGLTPQTVHALGGFRVQGKTPEAEQRLLDDCHALQQAGACMVVLELMPSQVGERITRELSIPTIGIGAGPNCSGQILVLYDMLDIYPGRRPRFAKNFMEGAGSMRAAVENFVAAVKDGSFPAAEHCF